MSKNKVQPELEDGASLALSVHDKVEPPMYGDTHPRRETTIRILSIGADGETVKNLSSDDPSGWGELCVNHRAYPEFEDAFHRWELRYDRLHYIDAGKLHNLYHGMQFVLKGLLKIDAEWGRATSFGSYALRLAKVIGAKTVITWTEDASRLNYSESTHLRRYWRPAEAVNVIDYPIAQWLAAERAKAQTDGEVPIKEAL